MSSAIAVRKPDTVPWPHNNGSETTELLETDELRRARRDRQLAFIEAQDDDSYGYHVRAFTTWIVETDRELDAQAIVDYFVELNGSTYSAATKRVKRQAVKKRLRQLARAQGLGSQFGADLEQLLRDLDREGETKAPTKQAKPIERKRFIDPGEYKRVIAACRGKRQELLIRFLWDTGARVSEMCGARLRNVRVEADRVVIAVRGKGNKERELRISYELFQEIELACKGAEYLFETANHKPYDRVYVSRTIAKVTERALGRPLRAHALRHSFATRMIESTRKIQAVSKYLGHSSSAITLDMYTHEQLYDDELGIGAVS